ncbi:hypothetical protein HYW99_01870 [Candidatus Woesearchaeota archaeon]|nr:hypothetical protein [Candidatus Woesearchaeota archaeon]
MTKNKLIWISAFISIIIALLPIAYAQTFAESPWFYILINAAIIFVVLFILQAVLVPGKEGKEKTATWIIILIASLVIAFLFGQQGFIWRHPVFARFLSIYVLVNAIIIGAVLYFVLGFILKDKVPKSPEGLGGYGILIFLVALIFAVNIGNQWIWHQSVVRQLIDYLFGAQGILNPKPPEYRLWAFIAVATLLAFFFQGYLLQGVAGGNRINYALAILIGASVARAGISFQSIVLLGEAIFTIVLAKALQGTTPQPKGIPGHWILAAFLVGWASAAMTYGTEYQGWLAWIVGTPLYYAGLIQIGPTGAPARPEGVGWLGWIFKMGLMALLIIGLSILSFGYVMNRGMLREGRKRLWQKIKRLLRRNETIAGFMAETLASRNEIMPDELPFELKDMRLEIYTLLNFMLRHEVWKLKTASFLKTVAAVTEAEGRLSEWEPSEESIQENLRTHIEGSAIVEKPDGTGWTLEDPTKTPGWGRNYWIIFLTMDLFKTLLSRNLEGIPSASPQDELAKFLTGGGRAMLDKHLKGIKEDRYNKYLTAVSRYKSVNFIRAKRLYFYDMYNFYGEYTRGYFFAKVNAKPDICKYEFGDNGVQRSIKWKTVEPIARQVDLGPNYEEGRPPGTEYLVELNLYGYSVSDINTIQIERKDPVYRGIKGIRKYRREDMQFLHLPPIREGRGDGRVSKLFTWASYDWKSGVEDMETGKFHPLSRKVPDYEAVIKKQYEVFSAVSAAPLEHELSTEETAFDREALKNPGKFVYWGRKTYFTDDPVNPRKPPVNPYPTLSLKGLWEFIKTYSKRVAGDEHKTEEILEKYFKMEYEDVEKGPDKEKQE